MSGYLKDNDGKTDWMIDGREGGLNPPMATEPGQTAPLTAQKSPPLNFQNDKKN
jgi:hypothetical protein